MFHRALVAAIVLAPAAAAAAPADVPGPAPFDPHAIAAAPDYACARTRDGHATCWGRTPGGEQLTPAIVPGLANLVGLAATPSRLIGWTGDGAAWQWTGGPPVKLAVTDVVELAADDDTACARHRNGDIDCWTGARPPGHALAGASAIAVAGHEACAIAGADVTCWTIDADPPAPVALARARGATVLAARERGTRGGAFAAVVPTAHGNYVIAWTRPDGAALAVPRIPGDAIALSVGSYDICALGASVTCWDDVPNGVARPFPTLAGARAIAVGGRVGCAAMLDGNVRCWGDSESIGDGTPLQSPTPAEVPGIADATELVAWAETTCARRARGRVTCWGTSLTDTVVPRRTRDVDLAPVDVPAAKIGLAKPSAPPTTWSGGWFRADYECARAGKTIECTETWHAHGESDTADTTFDVDLSKVAALKLPSNQENSDLCIARTSGTVECKAMPDGSLIQIDEATGAREFTLGPPVSKLAMSATCVATPAGTVVCWDLMDDGATPVPHIATIAGIHDAVEVAGSDLKACARRTNGHVVCWGMTDLLGRGTRATRDTPVTVAGVAL